MSSRGTRYNFIISPLELLFYWKVFIFRRVPLSFCFTSSNISHLHLLRTEIFRFRVAKQGTETCSTLVCTSLDASLMYCVPSNWLHTSISVSPLISYPSYFNSFRMTLNASKFDCLGCFWERTQSTFRNFE